MDTPKTPVRYAMDLTDLSQPVDPVAAHLCGWVSYYAYYDGAAELFSEALGATNILRFPADDATGRPQGWMMELPECNIVAFAGTTDYSQLYGLIRDTFYGTLFNVATGTYAGSVWAKHARTLYTDWHATIFPRMHAKKTLFTGHSLGGAIAACLLAQLRAGDTPGAQQSTCISFGCPRLGNKALATATYPFPNIVIPGDVVPKMPHLGYFRPYAGGDSLTRSVWPTDGFAKHGLLYYLNAGGVLESVPPGATTDPSDVGLDYDLTRSFVVAGYDGLLSSKYVSPAKTFGDGIAKHFMGRYLELLEKNIPNVPEVNDDLNGLGLKYEVEVLPSPPDPVLSTIAPPAYPTPVVSAGTRPLRKRRRH